MTQPLDPSDGVFRLGDGLTLAEIWTGLHSDAVQWQRAGFAPDTTRQRAAITDNTRALLLALTDCPVTRWKTFLDAQGVTQIGAIALSWCDKADLKLVAAVFLNGIETPAQIDERAAGLLNPTLLPRSRSLLEMADTVGFDVSSLVLATLGSPDPLIMDASPVWLSDLPAMVGSVLLRRYDPSVSALPSHVLEDWNAAA